jgi:hypothetical protein
MPDEPAASSPAEVVSSSDAAEPAARTGFFERIFGVQARRSSQEQASESEQEPPAKDAQRPTSGKPLGELSDTELDELVQRDPRLQRRVQAETDRREAKRQTDAQTEARRKLRREDPYAYAEQDEAAEQQQQTSTAWQQTFATFGRQHDEAVLDPLIGTLPEAEQKRILALEGAGVGLDGRKLIVGEVLKALEKHWRAEGKKDAEGALRKNPAFRKQVLLEGRAETEEPEELVGSASARNGRTFEDLILRDYRARRSE